MKIKTIGIIGPGSFGQFMASHLKEHFDVSLCGRESTDQEWKDVCSRDVLIFTVPFYSMQDAIDKAQPLVRLDTIITDVTSIKKRPLELLEQAFPDHQILGTHPIFGPQSGKDGIKGLPVVISNISLDQETYLKAKDFLSTTLGLNVIEQTPDQHDQEMAYIQGLAHFVGRALKNIDIKNFETNTFSYHQLVELKNLLKDDSWELFRTIQEANPYAKEVREGFRKELDRLEEKLGE